MAVMLCRVHTSGKRGLVLTIPPEIRDEMGLISRDVLGFRIVKQNGRIFLLGEKIQLGRVARIEPLPQTIPETETKNG
jgi:bifunctional DNA-binding transcriptional regulator/antitoxin component of YhaV-PrlF toxin-antitoxin module